MRYFASPSFWERYDKLSAPVRELADKSFEQLKADPKHPSLHFKKVGRYWSVRIGIKYRAIGVEMKEGLLWFWIGTHAEYDRLVK